MAPSNESIRDPIKPANIPRRIIGHCGGEALSNSSSMIRVFVIKNVNPIKKPPRMLAIVPTKDMAPFVPVRKFNGNKLL